MKLVNVTQIHILKLLISFVCFFLKQITGFYIEITLARANDRFGKVKKIFVIVHLCDTAGRNT